MKALTLKYCLLGLAIAAGGTAGGFWLGQQSSSHEQMPAAKSEDRQVLYWYDPMVPTQRFEQPGKSPFMDMELVPKYAGTEQDTSAISVPAQAIQNLGMRTSTVVRAVLPSGIDAVGSLAYNQREVATLQARSAGFVERVYGRAPGDVLPAGTPLADLLIPEWSAAQLEFIAVLQSGDARLVDAARERMRLLGMPKGLIDHVQRTLKPKALQTLVTPIGGELLSLELRAGMAVSAGQDLARLNGLSSIWLDAAIPESQAAAVQLGAQIRASLTAFPGQTLKGRVIALLPSADVQTRTLTVRSELPNPEGKLRPGMFASVRLNSAGEQPVLLIPSEAVIRTGKRALVMLAEGEGRYRPHEIQVGREADGRFEVLAGLSEGQAVVTSGQFLIDSEASLQGVMAQVDDALPEPPPLHEAQGVIRELDGQTVTLAHGPFNSLGMPGMTMAFELAKPEVATGLKIGDSVRIAVRQSDTGLVVEQLIKQGASQ
ncbi:efflux RND transporter periplasmic adaptor subunit [Pseudomonas sp. GLN_6]|jgi:Cu(I)/Ag(I) efflux system membrane fusion protein|uniref:efflux RND transporter periplasmic adaptor subunit n=1 Tax=unclassified Pseudomonas TaxID=196821 RepID=UPI000CCB94D7|nr:MULTISPECIES: efflux RND transporter periplasmic adaptor subunit [unclassified Pseudomonas]MBU2155764.1 efflux RND transporter periplasmic adaptor subunit [Gammaproteobacteria bacterium]MDD2162191.1 efflux RND transporter periplasmic adaptor subunit [Pseudomonas sp. MIL19]MDP2243135.1 efflux RND transporter periplasmic adaptor subunit [Pseudomonas sp.]PJE44148.1 MAG: efflux RND transporter periplasmic adaptor subunit [Pseudomonas sp.] [Pseudomonas sp. FEMGT703P]